MKWITKDGKRFPVHNEKNFVKQDKKIYVGIIRKDDPTDWTMIPHGSGNPESKQYKLPYMTIDRKDALKLKKQFGLREDPDRYSRGYIGEISEKAFNEEMSKSKKVHHWNYSKVNRETKPEPEKTDSNEVAKTIFNQLKLSKVMDFHFLLIQE